MTDKHTGSGCSKLDDIDYDALISEAGDLLNGLFPICRSITGNGVRETLNELNKVVNFDVREVPSGTRCYDWTVPDEWNIKDAFIKDSEGNRVVSFLENNLHVMGYSMPVDKVLSFDELENKLHTLPDLPNAIPYRTSYYNHDWGFCLTHEQYASMDRGQDYHVSIDSSLEPGGLTYGEGFINGASGKEYIISTYCCHPSLANDNLSGQVLWALLFRHFKNKGTRHSYRFVIVPETIGAIAYISQNESLMQNIDSGFVITSVAGPGAIGYKQSYAGNALIDRMVRRTFAEENIEFIEYPFDVHGSDERQYSSPAFRIPIGTICKDKYYEYDYYHTSLDNLDFISPEDLVETLKLYISVIDMLECENVYQSLIPHCEPMLGKRGLYPSVGGHIQQKVAKDIYDECGYVASGKDGINEKQLKLIRVLMFYCDGKTSLFEIAEKLELPMLDLYETAELLRQHELLELLQ